MLFRSLLFNQTVYFKRKRSMQLPCYCFYILKHSMFECPSEPGWHTLSTIIPNSYFRDFAENRTPDQIDLMPDDERPSIIFIDDYQEFKHRLINYLVRLGFQEEDILFTRITYHDLHEYGPEGWFELNQKEPNELQIKDVTFEHQSEARIIVNSSNQSLNEYLINNVIEIGDLSDISQKFDKYLFDGAKIEAKVNVELLP